MDTSWGEDQDILKRVRLAGKKLALHRDLAGLCLHNQHGENCSRSFAQAEVRRSELEASPLGPLLDALPLIGSALVRRGHEADGGVHVTKSGEEVVVRSDVVGGLFVWSDVLQSNGGSVDATLDAFTSWLWSGNGFSKERSEKLGLQRPSPPDSYLEKLAAEQAPRLTDATRHGLESLRDFEGMGAPHDPGAITNPAAYRDPAQKSAPKKKGGKLPAGIAFGGGSSFGNPTRSFTP